MCTRFDDASALRCHLEQSLVLTSLDTADELTDAHNHFTQGEVDADGKAHGTGKFQWLVSGTAGDADALYDVYEGQWHSGMMHGAGKKVWATGISSFNKP